MKWNESEMQNLLLFISSRLLALLGNNKILLFIRVLKMFLKTSLKAKTTYKS